MTVFHFVGFETIYLVPNEETDCEFYERISLSSYCVENCSFFYSHWMLMTHCPLHKSIILNEGMACFPFIFTKQHIFHSFQEWFSLHTIKWTGLLLWIENKQPKVRHLEWFLTGVHGSYIKPIRNVNSLSQEKRAAQFLLNTRSFVYFYDIPLFSSACKGNAWDEIETECDSAQFHVQLYGQNVCATPAALAIILRKRWVQQSFLFGMMNTLDVYF